MLDAVPLEVLKGSSIADVMSDATVIDIQISCKIRSIMLNMVSKGILMPGEAPMYKSVNSKMCT